MHQAVKVQITAEPVCGQIANELIHCFHFLTPSPVMPKIPGDICPVQECKKKHDWRQGFWGYSRPVCQELHIILEIASQDTGNRNKKAAPEDSPLNIARNLFQLDSDLLSIS